ncbi:hypothetical protein KIN20_028984 [Parelaphostrongylus tenuis]|uniref:Uncharacterized protein n=1 Tax=Parelaphostrongylus tenuis TaxID=148309 RepID=A0AAD5R2D6_PARTN|nr:hypothetical protein KIN20_028984 [Parelaphostrongylus tenuis]
MADRKNRTGRQGDNGILYIAALCVCDFLMSLSLPPAILIDHGYSDFEMLHDEDH